MAPIRPTKFLVNWIKKNNFEIGFQDGGLGGHLKIAIGLILSISVQEKNFNSYLFLDF